ncbi:MAG: acyl-CoA dehydrogenase [Alcaligenaceae bacterium]|nr:acyl-CoA dehydrogenase [Alcaligenaceae bacterium SAGV5]MPS51848.1 acyl-CoA dehydrogenase [Alcaligenaceae bacterium SAGV3]MPT56039.1 acyl-CoA dehydrogenase [Alcaligenaceae bacterium]
MNHSVRLPASVLPAMKHSDFSQVTYQEALDRAEGLIPLLRSEAEASERLHRMTPAVVQALHETGLFRIHQPRYWGGMELSYSAQFDVCEILGRGDASASWTFANLASHHRQLAQWPLPAQQDVLENDADALVASGIAYIQGQGRPVEGGLRLSGKWGFSSGVTVSSWNMLACVIKEDGKPVDWCMCLVPAADYRVLDDWHTLGMRGTGSCTVECEDVFVPAHRVLSMKADSGVPGFPGLQQHRDPLYRIPNSALGGNGIAAAMLGNAQAALDASIASVKERSTSYTAAKMRDFPTVQLRISMAGAKIDAARLMLRNDCLEGAATVERGAAIDTEARLRYRRNTAMCIRMATEAVGSLQEMAGANGIYDKYPIQRMYRDALAANGHVLFNVDMQLTAWGLVALGGEVRSPTV